MALTIEQQSLLPKSKHDLQAVFHLCTLQPEEVVPLVPELLDWVQDMNWPVALPVTKLILEKCPEAAVVPVRDILFPGPGTRPDDEWQNNVLGFLVHEMPRAQKEALRGDLERFHSEVSDDMANDWWFKEAIEDILAELDDGKTVAQ